MALLLLAVPAPAHPESDPPGKKPAAESLEVQLEAARTLVRARAYKEAIPVLGRVLALGEKDPRFTRPMRRLVQNNLGSAYLFTGDLESARKVFEKAIAQDPDWPFHYYGLATVFAEKGDDEAALLNLRRMVERRGNLDEGQQIPDLSTDPSFRRFKADRQFREMLERLATEGARR
jgi:tetratricopeptide (TPR) repeat protein